jgi:hypothetical protein
MSDSFEKETARTIKTGRMHMPAYTANRALIATVDIFSFELFPADLIMEALQPF